MEEYRQRHAQKYQERLSAKEEAERKIQEELERRQSICKNVIAHLEGAVISVLQASSALELVDVLHGVSFHLQESREIWQQDIPEYVRSSVMDVLEHVNTNTQIVISYARETDVQASREIQRTMKEILCMCSILANDEEDLDMDIAMDCSMDEEMARRLADEETTRPYIRQPRQQRQPRQPRQPRQRPNVQQEDQAGPSSTPVQQQEHELPHPIKKKVVIKKNITS